jgi:hypothetical protein
MQSGTGQSSMQSRTAQSMANVNITGGSALAGSLLFLLGVFTFFAGIAGFARANFYNVGSTYPYHLSSYGWGWLYVIGGVLIALTGLAMFSPSATWARPTGLVLAVGSAIANFFFLPFFPLWAFLMLATALFAIGALVRETGADAEARQQQPRMGATSRYGQQTGMGTQEQQRPGASTAQPGGQTGQRWPENASAQQPQQDTSGRQWAPSDLKDSASRLGDKVQEHAQAGARSGGQSGQSGQSGQTGRNMADDAAVRARQQQQQQQQAGQNQPGR